MNKYIKKDKKKRVFFLQKEIYIKTLKVLLSNQLLSYETRTFLFFWLKNSLKNVFKSEIHNRCVATGYSRSIFRRFSVSRFYLKKLVTKGSVSGVTKGSW